MIYKLLQRYALLATVSLVLFSACGSEPSSKLPVTSGEQNAIGNAITDWLVLDAVQWQSEQSTFKSAFTKNLPQSAKEVWHSLTLANITIDNNVYNWRKISSPNPTIDLGAILGRKNNAYSFLATSIDVSEAGERVLALGSDDAVKVWLNGKLVHENLALRGVNPDQDWVPLSLQAGKNNLLVQVFNASMGWGVTARMLTKQQVKDGFADAAVQLPLNKLQLILASGVDINQKNALGLTALHVATQKNNKARAQWLLANGSKANITMPASEQLVQNFIKNGISTDLAGASYLVINNGKVITKGGLGFADLANSQPITTSTKFRIGSLTKQFTAAAILKLVAAGQVSLDDQVDQYLPEFPKGENVTIRQLLNHTSGIANYTQDPNFWEQPEKYYTKEDMLNLIESLGYDFESGERFGYSNSGYYILGVIIEEVSEQSLATFFEHTFFKPLKMYHSGIYQNGYNYQNEAIGRRLENGKVVAAADTNMSQPAAAGAMYSTVEDLSIWNKALHNGQVLPLNLYQQMTSPGPLNHGNTLNHYGFGIGLNHFQGHQSLAHSGSIHGFSNYMGVIPDLGYQYILLTNMMAGHTTFTETPFTRIAELTQIN